METNFLSTDFTDSTDFSDAKREVVSGGVCIRRYERGADYEMVSEWWRERGREPVAECALSRDGYFCVVDGAEAACAWLYVCNSSDVARVCHLVMNPQLAGEAQMTARSVLLDFLRTEAGAIGKLFTVDEPFSEEEQLALRHVLPEDFADRIEVAMKKLEEAECEITHRFTPGLYTRQIVMPAGYLVTSRIHRTEHPYVISKGDISVWTKEEGLLRLKAPHSGITRPSTRRVLYAHEDTVWTTFHPTEETDPETIINTICEVPVIPAHLLEQ